ncbi:nucleotidyltransferase domain-containing protein [Nodosilinea sp. AN01ver1]|uniref:nucleotidyltransferase domain-containing protein n=1 Tax=Nodosilinea sp. AN01ver1 TaxID=3423362 RepID=UPI003D31F706
MITEQQIHRLCQSIAHQFRPEKIILFGSYAYGSPRADSDVDLLIVMPHKIRNAEMAMAIWRAIQPNFPVDLIVRSPSELVWRYQEYDPLIRTAVDQGTVLYEQSHPGVDS